MFVPLHFVEDGQFGKTLWEVFAALIVEVNMKCIGV
jgi:hypothetical protein